MMRDGKTCTHAGRNDVVEGETECRRERSPLGNPGTIEYSGNLEKRGIYPNF